MSQLMLEQVVDLGRVDTENNIIHGVAMIRKGPVNDSRGWQVTETTLSQVMELVATEPDGVRARYGHPVAGVNTLDCFLGRWKNFRREGDVIRADLHLAKSAFKTPKNGDIASYILELSQSDPRALGVSIAAALSKTFDGVEITLKSLSAFDIVDEPAGTDNGMFSKQPDFDVALSCLIKNHFETESDAASMLQAYLSTHYEKGAGMTDQKETEKKEPEAIEPEEKQPEAVELSIVPDVADAKEAGRAEERERVTKITSLCELSACPEAVSQLVTGGFSYAEAKELIPGLLERKNALLSANGGEQPQAPAADPDQKYRDMYKADSELCALSVSEDEYIASLKVSEAGGIL